MLLELLLGLLFIVVHFSCIFHFYFNNFILFSLFLVMLYYSYTQTFSLVLLYCCYSYCVSFCALLDVVCLSGNKRITYLLTYIQNIQIKSQLLTTAFVFI